MNKAQDSTKTEFINMTRSLLPQKNHISPQEQESQNESNPVSSVLSHGLLILDGCGPVIRNGLLGNVSYGGEQFLKASDGKTMNNTAIGKLADALIDTANKIKIKGVGQKVPLKSSLPQTEFSNSFYKSHLVVSGAGYVVSAGDFGGVVSSSILGVADVAEIIADTFQLHADIDGAQEAIIQINKTLDYLYYNDAQKLTVPNLGVHKVAYGAAAGLNSVGTASRFITRSVPGGRPFRVAAHGVTASGEVSNVAIRFNIMKDLAQFIENIPFKKLNEKSMGLKVDNKQSSILLKNVANAMRDCCCLSGVIIDIFNAFAAKHDHYGNEIIKGENAFVNKEIRNLMKKQHEWNARAVAIMQLLDEIGIPNHEGGISALIKLEMMKHNVSESFAKKVVDTRVDSLIKKNDPKHALDRLRIPMQADDSILNDAEVFRCIINDYSILAGKPNYIPKGTSLLECKASAGEHGMDGIMDATETLSVHSILFNEITDALQIAELEPLEMPKAVQELLSMID